MVRIRYVHMGLLKLPRFGAFFVLKGTAFRFYILEPVPDVSHDNSDDSHETHVKRVSNLRWES
jgi:hypothetical protein